MFALPYRKLKINVIKITELLHVSSAEEAAKKTDAISLANKIMRKKEHGLNIVIGRQLVGDDKVQHTLWDLFYRGDYAAKNVRVSRYIEPISDYTVLKEAATLAKVGHLDEAGYHGLWFYDKGNQVDIEYAQALFEFSVLCATHFFSTKEMYTVLTPDNDVAETVRDSILKTISNFDYPGLYVVPNFDVTFEQGVITVTAYGKTFLFEAELLTGWLRSSGLSHFKGFAEKDTDIFLK